jgi:hypothetical protein
LPHSITRDFYKVAKEKCVIPSIASLGVLKPRPMLFQNRLPPFPGFFPLPDFLELKLTERFIQTYVYCQYREYKATNHRQ